jgi:hypothetical protein
MDQRNSGLLKRAAFYRAQASEVRAFAAGELNSALRDTLLDIARQYEEAAAQLESGHADQPA